MVEVPEHLLRRSRERREALGLAPGGGEGAAAPTAPAADEGAETPASEQVAVPQAAAAAPAPVEPAAPPPPPPPPPPYVQAALSRPKIPWWAMPVLVMLPVWGIVYAGSLDTTEAEATGPLAEGQELFRTSCASCHGASGGGGVGPRLSGGEVLLTFPEPEAHVGWVAGGSIGGNQPYGDPARAGGPRRSQGGMPGFEGTLTEEEIQAVVTFERVEFGGEAPPAEGETAPGGAQEEPNQEEDTSVGDEGGSEGGGPDPSGGSP